MINWCRKRCCLICACFLHGEERVIFLYHAQVNEIISAAPQPSIKLTAIILIN